MKQVNGDRYGGRVLVNGRLCSPSEAVLYQIAASSPTNNSTSKQLFSFSKTGRWKKVEAPYNTGVIYNPVDLTKSKRATSFGVGERTTAAWMARGTASKSPEPGMYEIPSVF